MSITRIHCFTFLLSSFDALYFSFVPRMLSTTLVQAREDIFVSSLISSSSCSAPFVSEAGRSLSLGLTDSAVLGPANKLRWSARFQCQHWVFGTTDFFYVGSGDTNSGPHACALICCGFLSQETSFSIHSMWSISKNLTSRVFIFICSKYFLLSLSVSFWLHMCF